MKLTYVIITRNRRASLLATLSRLIENTPLPRDQWEAIVVDNASDDGSADAVAEADPWVQIVRLDDNEGMPARNHGMARADGKYICLLDDDSYPIGDAIPLALAHLDAHPAVGAVVACVRLNDGNREAPALPAVLLGGASVLRTDMVDAVGGFSNEFLRQAEEYEMSFRIWQAGWRIERLESVVFRHEKVPGGRPSQLIREMDLRNNLIVARRFLPTKLRRAYRHDWLRRYAAIARADDHGNIVGPAIRAAREWAATDRAAGRKPVGADALETILRLDHTARSVARFIAETGARRVALADFGKNIFAAYSACITAGVAIVCLADDAPAYRGMNYRGIPIVPTAELPTRAVDAVIVTNINPAQIDAACQRVKSVFAAPVLRLWEPSGAVSSAAPSLPPTPSPPSRIGLGPNAETLEIACLADTLAALPPAWRQSVDVGAHRGFISAALATLGHRVLAVEANPAIADQFAALHAAALADGAIALVRCAASDRDGNATLLTGRASTVSSLEPSWTTHGFPEEFATPIRVEVPTRRLAGLVADAGFARIGLLKVDVEGHELAALRGFFDQSDRPTVAMVMFEAFSRFPDAAADCLRYLSENGFARFDLFMRVGPELLEIERFDRPTLPHSWTSRQGTLFYCNIVAYHPAMPNFDSPPSVESMMRTCRARGNTP